ncbi:DUF3035 domain-containing protein [Marimonas lutisalis]|uniref:DUF3035 domain-containing protein n=1 Tax=Marimonas lutisalis TaxID=2545756 RepID=UPI0010F70603|nr:DUF3035 domain-containing protein [Marimonas lutisalis]
MRKSALILMMSALGLAACGGYERDITLRDVRSASPGPDEFSVLPTKPLQEPASYSDLPPPTPGAANLVDQNPLADGVAALGGRPERLQDNGVPAGDGALVRHASRNGVSPTIREELAAQDEDFRRRKSRFTKFRIVRQDLYNKVYKREALKPRSETERFRRSTGVRTPSSPPASR